jgi:hypothetical protein
MTSSNINLCSSFNCLNKIRHIWIHPNYHSVTGQGVTEHIVF